MDPPAHRHRSLGPRSWAPFLPFLSSSFLPAEKSTFSRSPCPIQVKPSLCTRTPAHGCLPTLKVIWDGGRGGFGFLPFPFCLHKSNSQRTRLGPPHGWALHALPRAFILLTRPASPRAACCCLHPDARGLFASSRGHWKWNPGNLSCPSSPSASQPRSCRWSHHPLGLYSLNTPDTRSRKPLGRWHLGKRLLQPIPRARALQEEELPLPSTAIPCFCFQGRLLLIPSHPCVRWFKPTPLVPWG